MWDGEEELGERPVGPVPVVKSPNDWDHHEHVPVEAQAGGLEEEAGARKVVVVAIGRWRWLPFFSSFETNIVFFS
jgi:hypothetical protein